MNWLSRRKHILAALGLATIVIAAGAVGLTIEAKRPRVPLAAGDLPGFTYEATHMTVWWLPGESGCRVPEQQWRYDASGASLDVKCGRFKTPEDALAACKAEMEFTKVETVPGTFGGGQLGDSGGMRVDGAWHWPLAPEDTAIRLILYSGCHTVSVHMAGRPLPTDAPALVDRVAAVVLAKLGEKR